MALVLAGVSCEWILVLDEYLWGKSLCVETKDVELHGPGIELGFEIDPIPVSCYGWFLFFFCHTLKRGAQMDRKRFRSKPNLVG
jgi:hypothetical protein